ncbi:LPXTG cell wall anchor domain-containing protein [Streptococcus anginosus]|uniref:SspB-related isopeptide-forming adhesin n=2 Tax=Streptococcus anginosus TaxID=1328 RepID=UPI001430F3DB|nr:SspB-related isopeptide-forming adhesin [Streptococcus anginosus]NJJ26985.1 LPXTG cell wall anchor domain-containing protein [Streptococcus anginosus]
MKSNETKTYGSIRKIKAYGTCGVILGLAALAVATTNGVQADEVAKTEPTTVAPANTATNLPDSQPAKTAEQQNQLNQAGQAQGNVTVQVDNSQVNQAAQAAQKEGVKVVQDASVDKGTTNTITETQKAQAEIAADQAKQRAAVEKTTEDYVKAKDDHTKAVEETKQANAKIKADNAALKEAHDKAEKAGQDVNQAVSTAKDKVKAEFKDAKVSESSKTIKVEATKDSYDAYTKEVEKVKTDNQKSTDTYIAEKRKENKEIEDTKAYNEGVRKRNAEGKAKVEAENAEIAKRNQAQLDHKKSVEDENAAITKRNAEGQAKVEAENVAIDDFNKKVAEHNKAEDARVAKEKAEAEKNKKKDGYLSEVVSQGLVFKNEADAHIDVKGADSYISAKGLHEAFKDITRIMGLGEDQLQQYVTYFSLPGAKDLKLSKDPSRLTSKFELYKSKAGFAFGGEGNQFGAVNSKVGKTVTVTYTNLKNSSYKGRAISKMELDVTVKSTSENIQDDVVFGFSKNPAKGIEVAARYKDTNKDYKLDLSLRTRFYDADGNLINFEDNKDNPNEAKGLLSLSSLNAYKNHVETARPSDTARFIQISGSSIVKHDNGLVYSNEKDNSNGNHFGLNQHNIIDSTTSPYYWYLAGALALKGTNPEYGITVTSWDKLGDRKSEGRFTPSIWFTVTSELAATGVPTRPQYQQPKERKNFTPEKLKEVPTPKLETPKNFTPEKLKEVPTPKAKLTLVKVNGVPTPTYKPKEKEPTVPVVPTVHVHDYKLSTRPQVQKAVENADKVNINGQYVAKNSLNRFVLQTETLPAGRKPITQLVFNDHLPQGFKVDLEKTKEANKGYEVAYNEKANLLTFKATTATLTSVNKDLAKEYKLADLSVWGRPQNDAADYENVFEIVVNGGGSNGYVRKSNKVLIHTPGKPTPNTPNDPKNPNRDPLKPEKHNYNAAGTLVDGKEMLPEGINYYVSKWTNRPNKNDKSGKEAIAKGFAYIEDYQDDAVTPLESRFQVKDAEGKAVNGLKMYHVLDRKTLSKALNDMIDRSGISPKGAFYMWVAEKPEEFYKAYVQTGMDLYFHTPMQNKKGFTGKYTNQTFQVQFGNGYYSNVVVNHVPKLKVQKRVYNKLGDGQNLDGKLIKLGDKFYYFLDGAKLPADRGEALKEYRFYDDFDEKGDEFTGEYKAMAGVDIKLKDGTVIKAGTDLSQYAELKYDKAKGVVEISMKQDFLDKVDNASEFDIDAAIQMKRIASGTFENTYKNVVNGHEVVSNTVKTSTPEPEKPQPKKPTPAPKTPAPTLPQTGTASGIGLSVLGMILAGLGLFGLKKHKEN